MSRPAITDLYKIDDLLEPEERAARDMAAAFVDKKYLPIIGKHFRNGTFPMELIPEIAQLGLLGCNLQGYGCAGLSQAGYGLAIKL